MPNYAQWYVNETSRLARDAFKLLCDTGCAEHWLYYKPFGLAFVVAQSKPDGFELVTGDPVPGNMTVEQLTMWIRRHADSVPVLPGGIV